MIVVKNARFVTDNKTVKCTMDYYVLLNGVPENSPRVAIGEARCAPEDKFNFKVGMDFAYDRAYAKAVEIAVKMNRPTLYYNISEDTFFNFMKRSNMVKLED